MTWMVSPASIITLASDSLVAGSNGMNEIRFAAPAAR
jgi:hypothetical protein